MWRSTSLFSTSTISFSPVVIFWRTRTIQVSGRLLNRWNRCPGTFRPRFNRNPRFITFDCKLLFQHFAVLSFFPIFWNLPLPTPVCDLCALSARSIGHLGRSILHTPSPPLQPSDVLHLVLSFFIPLFIRWCCLSLNPSWKKKLPNNTNLNLENCKFYC